MSFNMLPLAHTGITLGSAWLTARLLTRRADPPLVDYRLVLLGALLPDLVDKPLGIFLFQDTFSSGRIFAYTLLFAVLLLAVGSFLYARRGRAGLVWLSFGAFIHLGLDEMWHSPRTLLWPAFGWGFERQDTGHWLGRMLSLLVSDPGVYIPEIIGGLILVAFVWYLFRRREVYRFIRTGMAGDEEVFPS
jgi:hypothetical protein